MLCERLTKLLLFFFALTLSTYCTAFDKAAFKLNDRLTTVQAKHYLHGYYTRPTQKFITPHISDIPEGKDGDDIRKAIRLLTQTSMYMGANKPNPNKRYASHILNCIHCHQAGESGLPGTKMYSLPWVNVINDYPKLNTKSMQIISLEQRIIMMFAKGKVALTPQSNEIRLIMKYFRWLNQFAKIGYQMEGTGLYKIYLSRTANPEQGQLLYQHYCMQCHGKSGEGVKQLHFNEGGGYSIPPVDTGYLYMIPVLASFIYVNMPYGKTTFKNPTLSVDEAYDIAAYINTKLPRRYNPDRSEEFPDAAFKPDVLMSLGPYQHPYAL
jgi:thiosulfate dehydrogenase